MEQIGSCHNLTSVLVQMLRAIPDGLMTAALAVELADHSNDADGTGYWMIIHQRMSANKRRLLRALILHWQRVVHADNRMDLAALATCVFMAVAPDLKGYQPRMNDVISMMGKLISAPVAVCADFAIA